MITPRDIANELRVSLRTAHRIARDVPGCIAVGRMLRVPADAWEAYKAGLRVGVPVRVRVEPSEDDMRRAERLLRRAGVRVA